MKTWKSDSSWCARQIICHVGKHYRCLHCWRNVFSTSRGVSFRPRLWFDDDLPNEILNTPFQHLLDENIPKFIIDTHCVTRDDVSRDLEMRFRGYYKSNQPDSIDLIRKGFCSLSLWAHYRELYEKKLKELHKKENFPCCCWCTKQCTLSTSNSQNNRGRMYYKCTNIECHKHFCMWANTSYAVVNES